MPPARTSSPPRRATALAVLATALVGSLVLLGPAIASASSGDDEPMLTLPTGTIPDTNPGTGPDTTDNDFLDLERDPSECIGTSIEKPGCGRAPVRSGDRGGWMQWTVFGVMAAGIAFIGWRIVAGARRRPDPGAP